MSASHSIHRIPVCENFQFVPSSSCSCARAPHTFHTAYAVRRYFEVQLPETTRAILLGFAVLLPAVWVPVLAGTVWGPAAAGHRERVFALSSPNGEPSFERDGAYDTVDATELRAVAVGIFFFLSVPLGFFLPLFVEHFVSMAGQTL